MYNYKCQRCGNIQNSKDSPKHIHICNECNKVDIELYSIDLYKANKSDIIRIMENELLRRNLKDPKGIRYIWKTKVGQELILYNMETSHIENTINMLRRNDERNNPR